MRDVDRNQFHQKIKIKISFIDFCFKFLSLLYLYLLYINILQLQLEYHKIFPGGRYIKNIIFILFSKNKILILIRIFSFIFFRDQ